MVIGIDEVGRGAWAGPVVAAAVGFEGKVVIQSLADSKVLSRRKRQLIDQDIRSTTPHIGVGWVWPEEINRIGLTESVRLAMKRAVDEITTPISKIIIDGNYNFLKHLSVSETLIKADALIPEVSAASIIAKVARDTYMKELGVSHPQYGFQTNAGYGTKQHQAALLEYGILSAHRSSYKPIKKLRAALPETVDND